MKVRQRGRAAGARSVARAARSRRDGWADATLGVDLGGTKVALGVVGRDGAVLARDTVPTRAERPAALVIDEIIERVSALAEGRLPPTAPLGVGVAAQVARGGRVLFAPNLRWKGVPLGARLSRGLRRPVSVLNDVQAATFGEWRHGAGRGADDLVCVFVGTGVGGGIVAGGALRQGATGTAGEVGHLTVQSGGRKCRCPNYGCLEAYAGGWAIAERAKEAAAVDPKRGAGILSAAGNEGDVTSETVERAYRAGDELARSLMQETEEYLAAGLVSIVNAIDPAVLVLGGGVLSGYPAIVASLGRKVRARALTAAVNGLRVVPAGLGASSGLVGAAAYVRESSAG